MAALVFGVEERDSMAAGLLGVTKERAKSLALAKAHSIWLHCIASPRFAGDGVIFTSHGVIEPDEVVLDPSQVITTRFLSHCLESVRSRGYEVISLDQVAERLSAPSRGPGFVCFTFDDGYRNNLTRALPIFRRHAAPMNIYVTTGFPDRRLFYWWRALEKVIFEREFVVVASGSGVERLATRSLKEKRAVYSKLSRRFSNAQGYQAARALFARHDIDQKRLLEDDTLSWEELRTLARDPLVTLAAHSVTHPVLRQLDAVSAREEMAHSKTRLEEMLGIPIDHFAFPFGGPDACGEREFALAREIGYKTATTTQLCNIFPGHARRLWSLPRISLDSTADRTSDLDLHLSGLTSVFRMRLRHPAILGHCT
jgi:peptidoglycan/xylan/chitin deacetylase (PgdA/CDA1 family)